MNHFTVWYDWTAMCNGALGETTIYEKREKKKNNKIWIESVFVCVKRLFTSHYECIDAMFTIKLERHNYHLRTNKRIEIKTWSHPIQLTRSYFIAVLLFFFLFTYFTFLLSFHSHYSTMNLIYCVCLSLWLMAMCMSMGYVLEWAGCNSNWHKSFDFFPFVI